MTLHIVIDGYNLIRQSKQFRELDRLDMQMGRDALVSALAAYKRIKAYPITVVFDGHTAETGMARRDQMKGVRIRFSRQGELADTVIKRMASREKEKMLVVSSDHDIVRYAESVGAAVIGAAEFEDRLVMAAYVDMKGTDDQETLTGWQPGTKKKGPSRRLTKRKRKMQKKISKL
jgi:predicted RNA-binding protein with PIN domain